jgi:hypothetical protein
MNPSTSLPVHYSQIILPCHDTGQMLVACLNQNKEIILTNSMVQSPFWEANRSSGSQEIPQILCNKKVHYRIHKDPSPISILNQINLVHNFPYHLLKIYLNITSHLCLCLPTGLFHSGLPPETLYARVLPLIRATCPAHLTTYLITPIINMSHK